MWDVATGCLRLVDIPRQLLYAIAADGGHNAPVALSERVTAIVPAEGGAWLAVFERSIGRLDPVTGEIEQLLSIPGSSDLRLNDAVSGRDGILYVGSVDRSGAHRGELYAVNDQLAVTTVAVGLAASNGIDTSPSGDTLVYVDSLDDRLTLGIAGTEVAVPHPDGVAVDEEGYVWVALWGHGEVRRFSAEGALDRVIAVPTALVTNIAFGGMDLDELFITTAQGDEAAQGGAVFRLRPGVRGLAPEPFRFRDAAT